MEEIAINLLVATVLYVMYLVTRPRRPKAPHYHVR